MRCVELLRVMQSLPRASMHPARYSATPVSSQGLVASQHVRARVGSRRDLASRFLWEWSAAVLRVLGRNMLACRPMLGAGQAIDRILQFTDTGRHTHKISSIVGDAFGYVIESNRCSVSRKVGPGAFIVPDSTKRPRSRLRDKLAIRLRTTPVLLCKPYGAK